MTGPHVLAGSLAFVLGVLGASGGGQAGSPSASSGGMRAVVLGIAQDGGVPHIGCRQERCVLARRDPSRRERVACLGLVDEQAGRRFLIDATPDLPSQLESLHPDRPAGRPLVTAASSPMPTSATTRASYLGREALERRECRSTRRRAWRASSRERSLAPAGRAPQHRINEMEPDREIAMPALRCADPGPHRTSSRHGRLPRAWSFAVAPLHTGHRQVGTLGRRLPAETGMWTGRFDGTFEDPAEIPAVPWPTSRILIGDRGPSRPRSVSAVFRPFTNRLLSDEAARRPARGCGARDGQGWALACRRAPYDKLQRRRLRPGRRRSAPARTSPGATGALERLETSLLGEA
jgi:hypothetical protein